MSFKDIYLFPRKFNLVFTLNSPIEPFILAEYNFRTTVNATIIKIIIICIEILSFNSIFQQSRLIVKIIPYFSFSLELKYF